MEPGQLGSLFPTPWYSASGSCLPVSLGQVASILGSTSGESMQPLPMEFSHGGQLLRLRLLGTVDCPSTPEIPPRALRR